MKKNLVCIILISLSFISVSCKKDETTHDKIITVAAESLNQPLYYAGTIQPIKSIVITSPIDGVIVDMPFTYGEEIKKDQLLFTLSSTKFVTDYKAALLQFLKAKNEFDTSRVQLKETAFLHKNGLISDDDFKMKKSNYYNAQLGYFQARDSLDSLLKQINIFKIDLNNISIANIKKIKQAMNLSKTSENLKILSPKAGVVLAINKNEDNKKINCGDAVKQGDVLAQIGEMEGFRVNIKVNELTINEIKLGQKVKIEGIAFEDEKLIGSITSIDKQADVSSANSPTFNVMITVPNLTSKARKRIFPGMSAKVVISLSEEPKLTVPINALLEKDGQFYVSKWDEKKQEKFLTPLTLSKTTEDKAIVQSGLKQGDKIVVPD